MELIIDYSLLINICGSVYLQREKSGIDILDKYQIAQLNSLLKTDTGNFSLAFPERNMLVIYNDYFLIEYVYHPEPKVSAYRKPDKNESEHFKKGDWMPMKRIMSKQEYEEKEAKRKLMQARVFEKMGVRVKVEKSSQQEAENIGIIDNKNQRFPTKSRLKSKLSILIILLITLSVVALSVFLKREEINNDLTTDNIKGRVKSIKISEYSAIEKFGEIEMSSLKKKSISSYNASGNKEEDKIYKTDGSLSTRSTYKYDENESLNELVTYFLDNKLSLRFTYKYDTKGNRVENNVYDTDGSLFMYGKSNYDSNGNQSSLKSYDSGGSLSMSYNYKYDDSHNIIEETVHNSDGSLYKKASYKYDNKGNRIENNSYEPDGTLKIQLTYKYDKYDRKGNWLKKIELKNNNAVAVTEREIEYY